MKQNELASSVLVNSAYVGKEQQCREGGTEKGEDFKQGNEIRYVRFLLNIFTKYTTNRHIPFLRNFHSKQNLSDLSTLQREHSKLLNKCILKYISCQSILFPFKNGQIKSWFWGFFLVVLSFFSP